MKAFRTTVILAALAVSSVALADTVLTSKMHQDAIPMAQQPAKDYTQTVWMNPKMMRIDGEQSVLVRLEEKKLYLLDAKEKVAYAVDLPIDFTKLAPAEMLQQLSAMKMTVTVTPTDETKKIKQWNARRFNMDIASPMGMKMQTVIWATKDVKFDRATYQELSSTVLGLNPMMSELAAAMKKIEGVTALSETTIAAGETAIKMSEELLSAEEKPAPKGTYELPEGYAVKPFNLMEQMMKGQQGK